MANSTAVTTNPNIHGPFSIQDLFNKGYSKKNPSPDHQGVYVWGVKVNGIMYPMYVGEHMHIVRRVFEHLVEVTGGNKTIPDWSTITNVNRNIPALKKIASSTGILPDGLLYDPTGHFDIFNHTHPNQHQIQTTIRQIQEYFFVSWLDLTPFSPSESTLRLAEKIVAQKIGNQRLIGKVHDSPSNSINPIDKPIEDQLEQFTDLFKLNETYM